jgi:hypothetical protein
VKGDFTAAINWGDGSTSAGTIATNVQGDFEVRGQHTYTQTGQFSFTVAIQGPGGSSTTAMGTASVSRLAATAVNFKAAPGQVFSGRVAFFTSPNPSWGKSDFKATIAWGDGKTSPGTIEVNSQGGFDVCGEHTYSKAGTFLFMVTVNGPGRISSRTIGTAQVIPLTPSTHKGKLALAPTLECWYFGTENVDQDAN